MKKIFVTMMIALMGIFAVNLGVTFAAEGGLADLPGKADLDTITTGGGLIRGALFAASDEIGLSTTSTTPVLVPGMTAQYGAWAPAIIQYCADVYTPNDALLVVQAKVDGNTVPPGEIQLDGVNGAWARAHCFNFVSTSQNTGNHKVEIFWRSYDGKPVYTHKRSLVVWSY